jgi:hypothetical protein
MDAAGGVAGVVHGQTALHDVGRAGADHGAGGKYLILPPGYPGPVPDGYIPLPSGTCAGYALPRAVPPDDSQENIARAVAYLKTVNLYPLAAAARPHRSWWTPPIWSSTPPSRTTCASSRPWTASCKPSPGWNATV